MGQAKQRGTFQQRLEAAPPKPVKISKSQLRDSMQRELMKRVKEMLDNKPVLS